MTLMNDTNDPNDVDARVEARLQLMLDKGKLQLVEGLTNLGRSLGMSAARARQGLLTKGRLLTDSHISWEHDGRWVVAWQWYNSNRWAALVTPDVPRQEESPPVADQTVPMADGRACTEIIDTDPDDRERRDAAIKFTAMIDHIRASRLTRHDWRVSQRRNYYLNIHDCNVVVWRVLNGWRFRILHKATGVTWQSDTTLATEDEARGAALDKLSKRLPEFLERLAAERSRGAPRPLR